VAAPLKDAGHAVHALTLPGLESRDANRTDISLRDHVDAVVGVIDSLSGPVVLVGHSGGGAIAHAAVDARPDAVARVIYVDSGPLGDGGVINDELPVVDGEVPFPDRSKFGEADLVDLDDARHAPARRPQRASVSRAGGERLESNLADIRTEHARGGKGHGVSRRGEHTRKWHPDVKVPEGGPTRTHQ